MLTFAGPLSPLLAGVGLIAALLVLGRMAFAPALTTGLLAGVVVSDISSVLGKAGPLSAYLLALILAVVALVIAIRRGALRPRWSPFFLLAAVWLATRALSVLYARSVSAGVTELVDEAKGLVLLVVLTLLLTGVRRPQRIMSLAVGVVTALAAVTLVQEFMLHDSTDLGGLSKIGVVSEIAGLGARHSGTQTDPNFWGRVLLLFLPLALALAWQRRGDRRIHPRWWLLAVALLLGGEYLTQSRGDLIAALVTAAVTLALIVRNRVRLMACAAGVVVIVAMLPGVGNRLGSLATLGDPPANGVVDQSLLGREAALKAGLAMFRDSPLVGVGAGNFDVAGRSYQRELGLSALSLSNGELLAPHDFYLQMIAEGGVIGLVGWLVFYLGSLVLMWRTRRRFRQLSGGRDGPESQLSSAILAALIGWGVASIFLHLANLPILLTIVAFGAVLHLRARDAWLEREAQPAAGAAAGIENETADEKPRGSGVRRVLVAITVMLFAGSIVLGRVATSTTVGWSANAVVSIEPADQSAALGYSYAVLSRTRTMPTFVELASSPRFLTEAENAIGVKPADRSGLRLTAVRQPDARTFSITVVAGNGQLAQRLVTAVVKGFHDYLAAQRSIYTVSTLSVSSARQVGGARDTERWLALVADLLGLLTGLAAIRSGVHSRPPRPAKPAATGSPRHRPPVRRRSAAPPQARAPATTSLRGQAVRGFLWSALSFGGNKLFVFVSTLVLTRLLAPESFGVVAAGLTVIAYLEVLLDLGLSSALVHEQASGHGRSVHAAFTVNVATCTLLAVANFLCAPALADFFRVPGAANVFRSLSIYMLLRGVGAVQDALLKRDLRFREKAAADLTRAIIRGGLGVGLALAGWGVWSLVIAFLFAEAGGTTVAWLRTRYRPMLAYDWTTVRPLLLFGAPVAALQLLSELSTNSDYLVVGHQLGSVALGTYSIAFRLPELLLSNVFWIFSSVAFPVLSRARTESAAAFRRAMLSSTRLATLYGFPVSVGLALVSRDAVHVLFGTKWDAAATPMMLISLALGFASVGYASGDVFKAAGRPGQLLWINTAATVVMIVGFIVAAPHGISAVAAVHLCCQFVYAFVRIGVANRFMGTTALEVARAMWPSVAVSAGILLLGLPPRLLLGQGTGALLAIVVGGGLGAALGFAVAGRTALAEVRRMLGDARSRKSGAAPNPQAPDASGDLVGSMQP